jgi:serine protease inhibitor
LHYTTFLHFFYLSWNHASDGCVLFLEPPKQGREKLLKKFIAAVLVAALLLTGCTAPEQNSADKPASPSVKQAYVQLTGHSGQLVRQTVEPLDSDFAAGVNNFGLSAASQLYTNESNIALSPISLELALCMARMGAGGATKDEMTKALRLEDLTDEQITAACKALMWRANTGGMETANAFWLLDGYNYKEDYINTCTGQYMADIQPLVIPGAMDAVNAWAKEKTHNRIDQILAEEPDPLTRMIITNALYYLGDWELPFEANNTHDGEFSSPDGSVTVPFMNSEWSVPYYANDQFSMISLSFKTKDGEGHYAMAFILPAKGSSIDALLKAMDGSAFKAALSGATDQTVSISLPKFEFSYFTPLNDTLKAMGMKKAFSEAQADFSGITDTEPLYISSVLHKCYVRVDELGAEAAAVTAVIINEKGASPEPALTFHADRPFVFAIYSLEDGAIAFIGAVNDPS